MDCSQNLELPCLAFFFVGCIGKTHHQDAGSSTSQAWSFRNCDPSCRHHIITGLDGFSWIFHPGLDGWMVIQVAGHHSHPKRTPHRGPWRCFWKYVSRTHVSSSYIYACEPCVRARLEMRTKYIFIDNVMWCCLFMPMHASSQHAQPVQNSCAKMIFSPKPSTSTHRKKLRHIQDN